jgi:glycosyltransferase involved in cell wall biosynthesis
MTSSPRVSVVMPVHNAEETVEEAVRSLLQQTYADLEILVVDDGSTDRSCAVIETLRDPRIRLVRQQHGGICLARNRGCAEAKGVYLAVLDSDDIAQEHRIAAQVEYLDRHADVGLVGTHARFIDDDGQEWFFMPPVDSRALRRYLLWDNPFVHSSVMFRRQVLGASGGYTPGIVANEDYRLWIQVARSWELGMIPEVLVTYRVRRASASRAANRRRALRGRLAAQWEAARLLGPWYLAFPALAATSLAYALSRANGLPDRGFETDGRSVGEALRGFRRRNPVDRSR